MKNNYNVISDSRAIVIELDSFVLLNVVINILWYDSHGTIYNEC